MSPAAASAVAAFVAAGSALRGHEGRLLARVGPELLARLRGHKLAVIAIATGAACRFCRALVDWREPGGVAFADRMAAHVTCYERAEVERLLAAGRRAVESPDAPADKAELLLQGEALP